MTKQALSTISEEQIRNFSFLFPATDVTDIA
jgi:hypothetical protein